MIKSNTTDTIIVGAGLAGLSCAVRLYESGQQVLVLDAADAVGGRLRTDVVHGYLLDRGFQVYLDAYPETGSLLDLQALELKRFDAGAIIRRGKQTATLKDPFRHPGAALGTLLHPSGTLADKMRIARLKQRMLDRSVEDIWNAPETTEKHAHFTA